MKAQNVSFSGTGISSFSLPKKEILSTKGLTLNALLSKTDTLRISGSRDTIIKSLQWTKTKNGLIVVRSKMSSASQKNKIYDTWFAFLDAKSQHSVNGKTHVHAQCSCQDYMYTWEYANAAHNAARIFYGNGEAPDEKNPGYKPGLCKHLYRLAEELIRN